MKRTITKIIPILGITGFIWLMSAFMLHDVNAYTTIEDCVQEFGTWQMMSPAPNHHVEGAGIEVNGKLYAIAGFGDYDDPELLVSQSLDIYDPATDTWETRKELPFLLSHIQAAEDSQYLWIAGGFSGDNPGVAVDTVWKYEILTDTWTEGPSLPEPRASGALVRAGRTLHYIGGLLADRQTDVGTHWTLNLDDPAATWQTAPELPRPRNHFQAVVIRDVIYAVGGQVGHDISNYDVDWLDAYDLTTGEWSEKAPMPVIRSHFEASTFVMNDRIMAMGGKSGGVFRANIGVNSTAEYNPQTDTWVTQIDLPIDMYQPTAGYVNNQVIITVGGFRWNQFQDNTWISTLTETCQLPQAAPETASDSYTYTEKYPTPQTFESVLSNDTDINEDELSAILVTAPTNGILSFNADGTFTYTPDIIGIDTFTYKAFDGTDDSAITTVTLTVPNPPPTAIDDAYEGTYNTDLIVKEGVLSNDSDPNGDTLTAYLLSDVTTGFLEFGANGALTYTPLSGFSGDVTFTYAAFDGVSESNSATVTLNISNTDTPPPDTSPIEIPALPPSPTAQIPLPPSTLPPIAELEVRGSLTEGTILPEFVIVPSDQANGEEWYNLVIKDSATTVIIDQWMSSEDICAGGVCVFSLTREMLPAGLLNGVYTWQVRTWYNGILSGFSNPQLFIVNVPMAHAPDNFRVDASSGRPIILFDADPGTSWLQLYIEGVHNGWYEKTTCDATTCTIIPDTNPTNGTYTVWMQAWGAAGYNNMNPSYWSGPVTFTLNFPVPDDVTQPVSVMSGYKPSLSWNTSEGATWYELWIGTEAGETIYQRWYSGLKCSDICRLNPPVFVPESYTWAVRAWGPGGFSHDWTEGGVLSPAS